MIHLELALNVYYSVDTVDQYDIYMRENCFNLVLSFWLLYNNLIMKGNFKNSWHHSKHFTMSW